jgi:signal transduction histidine kinase
MWPTVPIAAILYLVTTWPPFFLRLYQVGWVPGPVLLVLALGVGAVIWACVYLEISQVQPILNRSDEVELLLAKLRDTNRELNQVNHELDSMRRDAASALETRSMFFSSATHDFRQRLHAMKLLAHSAIDDTGSGSKAYTPLRRLTDAVEDVEFYITDVLDFAKLEGGPLSPIKRDVTLQAIFHELDLNFEEVATAQKVVLTFRATDVLLRTDPTMLQRILENLISNAIKFTRSGVLVAARRRNGCVAIEVWDQGGGIPTELQSQIFVPFYQAPTVAAEKVGVGLGLAVVKRLADSLGCEMQVRSRIGRGSVMTVLVPASDLGV